MFLTLWSVICFVCVVTPAGHRTIREIKSELEKKGKKCQIICSSRIPCEEYGGLAKTVYSHYGLQTAELPQNLLLRRSLEWGNLVEQIKQTDVVIWDW